VHREVIHAMLWDLTCHIISITTSHKATESQLNTKYVIPGSFQVV